MNKLLSMISLSKRAGKLLVGFDRVKDAVYAGKVCVVLTAADLSEKSLKGVRNVCDEEEVGCLKLPFAMDELWSEIGQKTGILAVTDAGLAKKIRSMLSVGNSVDANGETGN